MNECIYLNNNYLLFKFILCEKNEQLSVNKLGVRLPILQCNPVGGFFD